MSLTTDTGKVFCHCAPSVYQIVVNTKVPMWSSTDYNLTHSAVNPDVI